MGVAVGVGASRLPREAGLRSHSFLPAPAPPVATEGTSAAQIPFISPISHYIMWRLSPRHRRDREPSPTRLLTAPRSVLPVLAGERGPIHSSWHSPQGLFTPSPNTETPTGDATDPILQLRKLKSHKQMAALWALGGEALKGGEPLDLRLCWEAWG